MPQDVDPRFLVEALWQVRLALLAQSHRLEE
jgi:hypothetical protein